MGSTRTILRAIAAIAIASLPLGSYALAQEQEADAAKEASPIELRSEQVVELINGSLDVPLEDVFSDRFLAAVPPAQLTAISAQFTSQFGKAVAVENLAPADGTRSALAIRMERAIATGGIAIDPADGNRITELVFRTFDPIDDDTAKISADLNALPGKVSAYFAPLGEGDPTLSINPDTQFAIGSTFKLYVLSALGEEIRAGKRDWADTVPLTARSFPSGVLQDWPQASPITLHTLAGLMISISDNTATDQLIKVLGRETIESTLRRSGHSDPARTLPFPTTLELFALKGSEDNLRKYISADEGGRRAILADFADDVGGDASKVALPAFTSPSAIDTVEWFASARDLAALFNHMRAHADPRVFELMAINPSVPGELGGRWSYAGYKGGSEPGVLNLTWLLTDAQGTDHILSLSWNDTEANLDESTLELIAHRVLALPR